MIKKLFLIFLFFQSTHAMEPSENAGEGETQQGNMLLTTAVVVTSLTVAAVVAYQLRQRYIKWVEKTMIPPHNVDQQVHGERREHEE